MKKLLAMLLVLSMLLLCTACGDTAEGDEDALPAKALPQVTVDNPVNYLAITLAQSAEDIDSITVYDDGNGGCYVEYVGREKKLGTFDLSVFHGITAGFDESGLAELNGQSLYEEGEKYASMFIQYADGTYISADYSGTIPQEFVDGYDIMDAYLRGLTAELPVYVPQPMVVGEVNTDALAALQEILGNSGIETIDAFTISSVPRDEFFGQTLGLTDDTVIADATLCAPGMMATAYSMAIVTVKDTANIPAVRSDFENNLDWNKWICVSASNALIAHKDNMVICLLAADELYQKTADAIAASGWSEVLAITNPGF